MLGSFLLSRPTIQMVYAVCLAAVFGVMAFGAGFH